MKTLVNQLTINQFIRKFVHLYSEKELKLINLLIENSDFDKEKNKININKLIKLKNNIPDKNFIQLFILNNVLKKTFKIYKHHLLEKNIEDLNPLTSINKNGNNYEIILSPNKRPKNLKNKIKVTFEL